MPEYWSEKDERRYQEMLKAMGHDPRAKEIASRTVNKKRRQEGRAKGAKKRR